MMKKEIDTSDITYVLMGKEAIMLYKTSLNTLKSTNGVPFKVGAYSSVKKFVSDSNEWDDFIEISKEDFLELRKHTSENKKSVKQKKGNFIYRFFNS